MEKVQASLGFMKTKELCRLSCLWRTDTGTALQVGSRIIALLDSLERSDPARTVKQGEILFGNVSDDSQAIAVMDGECNPSHCYPQSPHPT